MTGDLTRRLPERIDRAGLERIMQRAAELQAGERDVGEGLTADEVLALGRDVGIPTRYLQQAMLEEQTRTAGSTPATVLGRLVGPRQIAAQRVVRGEPAAVEAALLRWMDKEELLAVQRQLPGRITWERMRGVQAALRRGAAVFESGGAKFMLARADVVAATVTPLESDFCHVSLTADLRESRNRAIGGGVAVVGIGVLMSGVLGVLGALWIGAAAPVPVALGLGYLSLRTYRPVADRAQLGLERALDHLERGGVKPVHRVETRAPSVVEQLANEVRRALTARTGKEHRP